MIWPFKKKSYITHDSVDSEKLFKLRLQTSFAALVMTEHMPQSEVPVACNDIAQFAACLTYRAASLDRLEIQSSSNFVMKLIEVVCIHCAAAISQDAPPSIRSQISNETLALQSVLLLESLIVNMPETTPSINEVYELSNALCQTAYGSHQLACVGNSALGFVRTRDNKYFQTIVGTIGQLLKTEGIWVTRNDKEAAMSGPSDPINEFEEIDAYEAVLLFQSIIEEMNRDPEYQEQKPQKANCFRKAVIRLGITLDQLVAIRRMLSDWLREEPPNSIKAHKIQRAIDLIESLSDKKGP